MFVLRECFRSIKRSPISLILIALTIGVGVGLTAVFGYVAYAAQRALAEVESSITIDVYFDPALSNDQSRLIYDQLIVPSVDISESQFISKEDALSEYEAGTGQDVRSVLGDNPLPAGASVKIKDAAMAKLDAKIAQLTAIEGVADVIADRELGRSLADKSSKLEQLTTWLGVLMFTVILVVVVVSTKLTIELRKSTLRIMSLLGATRWKVNVPFVLEGVFAGLLGGFIAIGVLIALDRLAIGALIPDVSIGLPVQSGLILLACVLAVSTVLGGLGSLFSLTFSRTRV